MKKEADPLAPYVIRCGRVTLRLLRRPDARWLLFAVDGDLRPLDLAFTDCRGILEALPVVNGRVILDRDQIRAAHTFNPYAQAA